jgi:ATP-dependent exoDNAse (exonuclease V) alpha subunit
VVILELERLGFRYRSFEANEIDFENDLSIREINQLDESLSQFGLELIFKKSNLFNKIRQAIHELKKEKSDSGNQSFIPCLP